MGSCSSSEASSHPRLQSGAAQLCCTDANLKAARRIYKSSPAVLHRDSPTLEFRQDPASIEDQELLAGEQLLDDSRVEKPMDQSTKRSNDVQSSTCTVSSRAILQQSTEAPKGSIRVEGPKPEELSKHVKKIA
mmetsp:Transcript_3305/g.6205  ORF Transcript_3305/g.6205 Transcript_3305/m.6205 type:complete len:133 (+) Transcript_3305:66-464(+)